MNFYIKQKRAVEIESLTSNTLLLEYLDNKPLYYDKIDYTRMPRVYEKVRPFLRTPKIVHLVGTNGKGTTGRFLASAIYKNGYSVGHYTSPHIHDFNERVWMNGSLVSYDELDRAHIRLQKILDRDDSDSLSYFEYTTLIAAIVYESCDYIVMEAGLGGEHDATAVFKKHLTLVTPISFDHEAFLGDTIDKIATTKLNAIQNRAIIARQNSDEVYEVAKRVSSDNNVVIKKVDDVLDKNDYRLIDEISKELSLVEYLRENLSLSIAALKELKIEYSVADFNESKLFGRLSKISDNIIVDVGHNALAAYRIAESLSEDKYIIIYNSYKDKDYNKILEILKPISLHVEIIEVDDKRIESSELMEKALDGLGIEHRVFKKVDMDSKYLVFGSFSVVEAFLKEYNG